MQVLILAAGYATRLYPLTLNQPKPLLPVAGKPMLEHVIDHLAPIPDLGEIFVVTNQKFVQHFTDWSEKYKREKAKLNFKVINDGTTSDADKLGAIGDIHLVMKKEKIKDDLVVVAGDNLFDSALTPFAEYCRAQKKCVLAVYDVGDLEAIKKYNSITLDPEGRVTFFEEKPKNPTSTLTGIALYYFPADVVKLIDTYIAEGNNPDQPGRLIQWLYPRVPVMTWKVPGRWFRHRQQGNARGSRPALQLSMNFFPDICVAAEFVGLMLWVTTLLDTANGKERNLPLGARRLSVRLMIWPVALLAIWIGLKMAGA